MPLFDAVAKGLAPDGGLYVPEEMPRVQMTAQPTLAETARRLLAPFFSGDALEGELASICDAAFTFDAPVIALGDDHVLELFHGPTAAFKDFGARFLAETLSRNAQGESTVLVATSGDTGAAVAAAFAGRPGFRVVVLYPDGRVSPRQAHQLGAFGGNVRALRVTGSFDDCQALVKRAFADASLANLQLRSANSISLGRLLPQMVYYAHTALQRPASFVVPTGNLGNAVACLWARVMGLPIDRVILASNANRVVPDWVNEGRWAPGASLSTLANAMDVGAPSNAERLRLLYPDDELLRAGVRATSIDDDAIRETIVRAWQQHHYALCPHTACGVAALDRLEPGARSGWIVAATAHPAKFESIVEPLIGNEIAPPASLAALLARPAHATPISADYGAFVAALTDTQRQ